MQLYTGSTREFVFDVARGTLASELEDRFAEEFSYRPPASEVRSWRSSLGALASVVEGADLDDHGVLVEYQLPLSSRRLDCMFTGHSANDPAAVIVELKQWDDVKPSWVDDCVTTYVGGGIRDVLHPSAQAGGYRRYLLDTNTAFADDAIRLDACAYLHNLSSRAAAAIFEDRHFHLLEATPAFAREDDERLGAFLAARLPQGGGADVLERVTNGVFRPHKQLLAHTARVIRNEPAWILLDEQQVALNAVLTKVRERQKVGEHAVFLIRGGPGTGKSVIAINLLAELSALGFAAQHVTGSRAFTGNLRRLVGRRSAAQFGYFNTFGGQSPPRLDVLIADEAHRMREPAGTGGPRRRCEQTRRRSRSSCVRRR